MSWKNGYCHNLEVIIGRGLVFCINLLTTYTHESELQAITAPPLIATGYKSPQYRKAFPVCYIFTSRSLATATKSGDSSAPHAQVLSSQSPVQNLTQLNSLLQLSWL
jgi:hypothetical protein